MKKIYMTPEMETIELKTVGMLAQSLRRGEGTIDPGDIGAPSLDWDDDEDEY